MKQQPDFSSGVMVALKVPNPERYAVPGGTPPEELHVTLAYLGDVEDLTPEQRESIRQAARETVASYHAIPARFPTHYGTFDPDPENGVPFWAKPEGEGIYEFRRQLVDALERHGVNHLVSTKYGFNPHVTLAYMTPEEAEAHDKPQVDFTEISSPDDIEFTEVIVAIGPDTEVLSLSPAPAPAPAQTAALRPYTKRSPAPRIDRQTEQSLRRRAELHNRTATRAGQRVSLELLKAVYLRGAESHSISSPERSRAAAGERRVREFLSALTHRVTTHPDADLFPRSLSNQTQLSRAISLARETGGDEVAALLVAAAVAPVTSPERVFHLARALALTAAAGDPLTRAALHAPIAALLADGNSRLARSLRARRQLRDRKGRWIEMGGGIRFKVKKAGAPAQWFHGTAVGQDIPNGRVNVKLEDGRLVSVQADKVEQPLAIIRNPNSPDAAGLAAPGGADADADADAPELDDPEEINEPVFKTGEVASQDDVADAFDEAAKELTDRIPDNSTAASTRSSLINSVNTLRNDYQSNTLNRKEMQDALSDLITFAEEQNQNPDFSDSERDAFRAYAEDLQDISEGLPDDTQDAPTPTPTPDPTPPEPPPFSDFVAQYQTLKSLTPGLPEDAQDAINNTANVIGNIGKDLNQGVMDSETAAKYLNQVAEFLDETISENVDDLTPEHEAQLNDAYDDLLKLIDGVKGVDTQSDTPQHKLTLPELISEPQPIQTNYPADHPAIVAIDEATSWFESEIQQREEDEVPLGDLENILIDNLKFSTALSSGDYDDNPQAVVDHLNALAQDVNDYITVFEPDELLELINQGIDSVDVPSPTPTPTPTPEVSDATDDLGRTLPDGWTRETLPDSGDTVFRGPNKFVAIHDSENQEDLVIMRRGDSGSFEMIGTANGGWDAVPDVIANAPEQAPPTPEPAPEPEPASPGPSPFTILPIEQRGQSGDGYHSSGSWGKFGASGLLIRAADDSGEMRYLIVQRSQTVNSNKGKWQLPGGARFENETFQQGAAREAAEEIAGMESRLSELKELGNHVYDNGQGWEYHTFAAELPETFDLEIPQESKWEISDAKWVTASELRKMSHDGQMIPALNNGAIEGPLSQFGDPPTVSGFQAPDVIFEQLKQSGEIPDYYLNIDSVATELTNTDGLNDLQRDALIAYSYDAAGVNAYLRGLKPDNSTGPGDTKSFSARVAQLDQVMQISRTKWDMQVNRTVLGKSDDPHIMALLGAQVGDVIHDSAYSGTTLAPYSPTAPYGNVNATARIHLKINVPAGSRAVSINKEVGFSSFVNTQERELLLDREASFEVVDVQPGTDEFTDLVLTVNLKEKDWDEPAADGGVPDTEDAGDTGEQQPDGTPAGDGASGASGPESQQQQPLSAIVYDVSGWKKVGGQKGSNPGGTYQAPDGTLYYVKTPKTQDHAHNEVLVSALYQEVGIPAAHVRLGDNNGDLVIVSKLVPDAKANLQEKLSDPEYVKTLQRGFATDAWLANWDVAGLSYDNIVTDENGLPVRIDGGGALIYRAQGAAKGPLFGDQVNELQTLRDSKLNPTSAKVFGGMSDLDIRDSARRVRDVSEDRIDEIVNSSGLSDELKAFVSDKLKARRLDLLDKTGLLDETAVSAPTAVKNYAKTLDTQLHDPTKAPGSSTKVRVSADGVTQIEIGMTVQSVKDGKIGTVVKYDPSDKYVKVKFGDKVLARATKTLTVLSSPETSTPIPEPDPTPTPTPAPTVPKWEPPPLLPSVGELTEIYKEQKAAGHTDKTMSEWLSDVIPSSEPSPEPDLTTEPAPVSSDSPLLTATQSFIDDTEVNWMPSRDDATVTLGDVVGNLLKNYETEFISESDVADALWHEYHQYKNDDENQNVADAIKDLATLWQNAADNAAVSSETAPTPATDPVSVLVNGKPVMVGDTVYRFVDETNSWVPVTVSSIGTDGIGYTYEDGTQGWVDPSATLLIHPDTYQLVSESTGETVAPGTTDTPFSLGTGFADVPSGAVPLFTHINNKKFIVKHPDGGLYLYDNKGGVEKTFSNSINSYKNSSWFKPYSGPPAPTPTSTPTPTPNPPEQQFKVGDAVNTPSGPGTVTFIPGIGTAVSVNLDSGGSYLLTPDKLTKIDPDTISSNDGEAAVPQAPAPVNVATYPGGPGDAPFPGAPSLTAGDGNQAYVGSVVIDSKGKYGIIEGFEPNGTYAKVRIGTKKYARALSKLSVKGYAGVHESVDNWVAKQSGLNHTQTAPPSPTPSVQPVFTVSGPDPDHPLYGTDKPQPPTSPFDDNNNKFVTDEWMAKADQAYQDRKKSLGKPTKPLSSSGIFYRYQNLRDNGALDELDWMLKNNYIDQALYDEAKAQVAAAQQVIDNAVAEYNLKLADFQNQLQEWYKANGVSPTSFPGAPKNASEPFTGGAADWTKAHPGTPAAADVFSVMATSDPALAARGASFLADSDSIEDLDVRVMHVIDTDDQEKLEAKFKLTAWAGDALETIVQSNPEWAISSHVVLKNRSTDQTTGLPKYMTTAKFTSPGTTYTYTDQGTGIRIEFGRVKTGKTDLAVGAVHNQVRVFMPITATAEDFQGVLDRLNVKATPATEQDIESYVKNKLVSVFGGQTDATKNLSGEAREAKLAEIKSTYGVSVSDVMLGTDANGRTKLFLSDSAAEKMQKYANIKGFSHNVSNAQDVSVWMKLLSGPMAGLQSTYVRWSEGLGGSGMSSQSDMNSGGGDYVFTKPMHTKPSKASSGFRVVLHPKAMMRRLDHYSNQNDNGVGKHYDGKLSYDIMKGSPYEVQWKHGIPVSDFWYVQVPANLRTQILSKLKEQGVFQINGIPIEQFVLTTGMAVPSIDESQWTTAGMAPAVGGAV